MHEIKQGAGAVVAADTQSSIAALDSAVAMQARWCASVLEAAGESKLPIAATQALLTSIVSGMGSLVASRADVANAVRELVHIQGCSTLSETSFGCPNGLPPIGHSGPVFQRVEDVRTLAEDKSGSV